MSENFKKLVTSTTTHRGVFFDMSEWGGATEGVSKKETKWLKMAKKRQKTHKNIKNVRARLRI